MSVPVWFLAALLSQAQVPGALASTPKWVLAALNTDCTATCTLFSGTCTAADEVRMKALSSVGIADTLSTMLDGSGTSRKATIPVSPATFVENGGQHCPFYNDDADAQYGSAFAYILCGSPNSACGAAPTYYAAGGSTNSDATGLRICSCTGISDAGGLYGDPIAAYGNVRVEFHLPVGVPVLLFQGRNLKVYGTTFPGLFGDQWMARILVLSSNDDKVLDVSIKDNLLEFKKELVLPGGFETLNVQVWNPTPIDLQVMPSAEDSWVVNDLTLAFSEQEWGEELHQRRGAPRKECISVASAMSKISVCSASAQEYFGIHGMAAWDFAHLDIDIVGLTTESVGSLKGVLPEVWGLSTISERTKSFIVKRWTEESEKSFVEGQGTLDRNLTRSSPPQIRS